MNNKNLSLGAKNPFQSHFYALKGLMLILKNERNFRIELIFASFIVVLGFILNFTHQDWVAVSLLIALVLISESFNSVIEALCDTVSHEYRVNIQYAKDVSAGAVLISAIVSVVAGAVIVIPHIIEIVKQFQF